MHAKALQAGVACCDPPARPARPAAWLSTRQPCVRAGQSTEGSKGSVESGRTSRGATSNAPSGSSTKRRLDGADMRSPPPPPSQTRRSWAAAAMAPPRAPPRDPCAGLGCNLCRWCLGPLAVAHEHGEDGCSSRQKPSLADWTRHATCGDAAGAVRAPRHAHSSGQQRGRSAAAWPQADGPVDRGAGCVQGLQAVARERG